MDARARLGCAISAGWGMAENGLVTCNGLSDPEDKVFGTDGAPLPGMALRVVDEDGREAPPGGEGDLLVTEPAQFVGYFKRPERRMAGSRPATARRSTATATSPSRGARRT